MAVTITYPGILANGATFAAGSGSGQYPINSDMIEIDCELTLSGSYVAGGDPVNFSAIAPPSPAQLYSYAPTRWLINELQVAGTALSGFQFNYLPGPTLAAPTQAGGVLQITGGSAASKQGGVQIDAGTYAGQTPSLDGVRLRATFWFARN